LLLGVVWVEEVFVSTLAITGAVATCLGTLGSGGGDIVGAEAVPVGNPEQGNIWMGVVAWVAWRGDSCGYRGIVDWG
jgi:hypothetical protein